MVNKSREIISFDGINRAGKGTVISNLSKMYSRISTIIVRGDGTREGDGTHPGEPLSNFWIQNKHRIRNSSNPEDWDLAADKITRERLSMQDRYKDDTFLVDRSLVSRAFAVENLKGKSLKKGRYQFQDLYPFSGSEYELEDLLGDFNFYLKANEEALTARLDHNDPKYAFRAANIRNSIVKEDEVIDKLPYKLSDKLIIIDANKTSDEVFREISWILNNKK